MFKVVLFRDNYSSNFIRGELYRRIHVGQFLIAFISFDSLVTLIWIAMLCELICQHHLGKIRIL